MIDLIKLCLLKVAVGKGCKAAIFLSISCNSKGYLFTQFGNRHVLQHSWKWSKLPLLCHILCCLKIQFRNKAKHLQGSCSRQDLGSGEVLHINECLPCTNVRAVGVSITQSLHDTADFCNGLSVSCHLCCQIKYVCKQASHFSFVQIIHKEMNSALCGNISLLIFQPPLPPPFFFKQLVG